MTVTIDEGFQITPKLRRLAGFKLGDTVRVSASRGIITIVQAPAEETPFMKALRACHEDAKKSGTDKLTMRQINAEIAAYRSEKRKNKADANQRAK